MRIFLKLLILGIFIPLSAVAQVGIKIDALTYTNASPDTAAIIINQHFAGRLTNDTFRTAVSDLFTGRTLLQVQALQMANVQPGSIAGFDSSGYLTNITLGTGTISATLTAPFIPYATAPDVLADSAFQVSDATTITGPDLVLTNSLTISGAGTNLANNLTISDYLRLQNVAPNSYAGFDADGTLTNVAAPSASLWTNNAGVLEPFPEVGSLLLGTDTSHGSQLFYTEAARTATTWFSQDGSGANIAVGSGSASFVMSGPSGASGFTFQPTVSDATTPYVLDTTIAHTTGSVLELKDLGTNLLTVNPASIQLTDRLKILLPRDGSNTDFQAQLRSGVYNPISFDVGNSDFTITSTYFNFQNSVQTNLATARAHPVLVNSLGVASSGLQAWSPALSWHGSGWSTGLSASRDVLFDSAVEPIQGTEATGVLRWYGTISTNATKEVFGISSEGPAKLGSVTKAQKTALLNPENGMLVYQTDNTPGVRAYIGGTWFILQSAADP